MTTQMSNNNTTQDNFYDHTTGMVDDTGNMLQFITFRVCDQEYGIDIMSVREIKGWNQTTSLPNEPHYMRGVINLRGIIVPIMDLRARFGAGQTDATDIHVVMIVNFQDKVVGILVDAVSDILTVHPEKIRAIPDSDQDTNVLSGIVNMEDRMVALIMTDRLFNKNIHFENTKLGLPNDLKIKKSKASKEKKATAECTAQGTAIGIENCPSENVGEDRLQP